ncbi:MAG: LysM peptidoglycan-binding domain-containing protein [Bacteroidota bacterium]|nr:LysM peptidoglycan-binding domain-containing protein [Bacteroidota bacterium]MDP4191415.1 LysM peptidoglycan-binding domain-containing protein [Bacteroidota bacterium]MDP4193638.1 LysM peptidoglycan-binding domain-containing protein [Bacteroidota bacterium]
MSVKDKYGPVINLMQDFGIKDNNVREDKDSLIVQGTANTQYEKNQIWDKIKEIGGENPKDIKADIKVKNTDFYATHKVKSGENLSQISRKYYGDPNRYRDIASYNNINNPDKIEPGQELKIPNP